MDDLVTWLLTQVGRDEMEALAASPSPWRPNAEHDQVIAVDNIDVCDGFALSNNQLRATVDHIVAWDPTRVLAECETKRRMIELHRPVCVYDWNPGGNCAECSFDPEYDQDVNSGGAQVKAPCPTVRLLALPYADRPGYRVEWRP